MPAAYRFNLPSSLCTSLHFCLLRSKSKHHALLMRVPTDNGKAALSPNNSTIHGLQTQLERENVYHGVPR